MTSFPPEVVAAVLNHMNNDHTADSLIIARAFGRPEATTATMTGIDDTAGTWSVTDSDGTAELRVPWGQSISERAQIRREVVLLYREACRRLGLNPYPEQD
ncbi:DUF2470 domain-containing protein [Lysinibacter sp. HNR]|uniref:DUF2470 domain-containing protein n=1 Tax=Lysinibacter sp. HNR TaxID=3031408 RepID=UPI0024358C74|nr:DUF2470 domain-containing protein [Lysinibacter sp. HNR]WGD37269.1 DUF2470 domain-containing protein [Lysinibacter sp. HNR]